MFCGDTIDNMYSDLIKVHALHIVLIGGLK